MTFQSHLQKTSHPIYLVLILFTTFHGAAVIPGVIHLFNSYRFTLLFCRIVNWLFGVGNPIAPEEEHHDSSYQTQL